MKRLLATALCAWLSVQGAAQAFAAVNVSAAGSASQGLNVPAAPLQLSSLSIGSLGGLGASAPSLSLQGALPGIKTPDVKTTLPAAAASIPAAAAASPASASPVQLKAAAASVAPTLNTPAAAAAKAVTPAAAAANIAIPGARTATEAGTQASEGRQAVAAKAQALGKAAAPVLDAIRDASASASSQYAAGHKLADILSGQRTRSSAGEAEPPVAAASPALSRSGLRQGRAAVETAEEKASTPETPVPELSPEAKAKFRRYAFGVSAVKTGLDALNLAVPLLLLDIFHAATAVSILYLTAELARLASGTLGGSIIDRIGAGRALALTVGLQIAATASLPFALALGGSMAMPLVYGAFILNGIGYELFDVARRAVLPQIVGRDEGVLRAHNGRLYVWRETAATAGVFGAGYVVKALGAMTTIWIHPIFCGIAALALLTLWNVRPKDGGKSREAEAGKARMSARAWWNDLLTGMRHVFTDRHLRALVLINVPLTAVHKLFHTVVAVVLAAQVLGNPNYAALLVGAWNIGELIGSFYLDRRGEKSHFSTWLRLAAAASLATWAFYLTPTIWVAVPAAVLIAAAMIGNELGTAAYMQSKVPEKDLGSVTGFVYGFSRAISMVALVGAGWAFDALSPQGGFLVLAIIFTLMAPIYLIAAKHFSSEHMGKGGGGLDDD